MTYTSEVLVQQFNVSVDDFENGELVVTLLHGTAEVETGVSGIDLTIKSCTSTLNKDLINYICIHIFKLYEQACLKCTKLRLSTLFLSASGI
jgi:hypothetical protein